MSKLEQVARAIDPSTWANWDNWCVLKGYTATEAAEEYAASPSLHKSLDRARAALEAIRVPDEGMRIAGAHALDIRPSEAATVFTAMGQRGE